jgi:putative CocE/NonD family hydrolase
MQSLTSARPQVISQVIVSYMVGGPLKVRSKTFPLSSRLMLVVLALISACAQVAAQNNAPLDEKPKELAEWIKANYTKFEYRVPMRDGVHLFTSVYVPKDASPTNQYPILFDRTPYTVAPYGEDQYKSLIGPSELFARSKYIIVYQDVRGKFMSEGQFVDMRPYIANKKSNADVDESSDTYDTVDWLVKNIPNNNGKVGIWGISYPGFYSAMGMIDAHPAVKAVSPQAPIADWFIGDDFHHNGALYLPHMFSFMYTFGQPRPEPTTKWAPRLDAGTQDGYEFFSKLEPLSNVNEKYYHHNVTWWDEIIQHPNYDAFWKARSTPQFLRNIKPAVLTVGGWFDAEDLWGVLHTYEAANRQSPGGDVKLVMGPWCHGCWARTDGDHLGNVSFNQKASVFYREKIEFPFFEHYLKGAADPQLPEAYVFETGSNEWRKYDAWPPKSAKSATLYLGPNGMLSFTPTKEKSGFDEYVSDPKKPVPYITDTALGMTREHMTDDQRLAGRRTDVLVYQTEPLEEDVTFSGPLKPELFVSTSGTDSDYVVKLIDVYPDDFPDPTPNPREVHMGGYQQLVRGELFRGRFRNSYERPEPFKPGAVTKIAYEMPDVNHTFRTGHRIMIQVQSTWFPLADLNPQSFVPNIYLAKPADFVKATERVYYGGDHASKINVLVNSVQ